VASKFSYSKTTIDLRDKYNTEIDAVIKQLETLKVEGDNLDVTGLQHIRSNLSHINSLSNRKSVERAYSEFYDSATLDLEKYVRNKTRECIVKQYGDKWAGVLLGTDVHVTGSHPQEMIAKICKGLGINESECPVMVVYYDEIERQLNEAISSEDYIEIQSLDKQRRKEQSFKS